MHSREIIRLIEAGGWVKVAQKGDHVQFKHPIRPGRVTVVHPLKDVSIGVIKDVERKTGVRLRHRRRRT